MERSIRLDGSLYELTGELFSNGFRYMNWSIDVPVLLTELLIVAGITGVAFRKRWAAFVIAGLAMIWTGYIGQFDEIEGGVAFWGWGAAAPCLLLALYVAWQTLRHGKLPLRTRASGSCSTTCGSCSSFRGRSTHSPIRRPDQRDR